MSRDPRAEAVAEIDGAIRALRLLRDGVQQPDVSPEVLAQFVTKLPKLYAAIGALAVNQPPITETAR